MSETATNTVETTPPPAPTLRKAAAEVLLTGALLLADAQRDSAGWNESAMAKHSEKRFREALQKLCTALGELG